MLGAEEVDELLQRDVALDEEAVPNGPFDVVVLCRSSAKQQSGIDGRTLFFAIAIGSEKPKNGSARLTNPFLYCSMSVLPSMIYPRESCTRRTRWRGLTLYSSRQTSPVAKLVVVAIAGMILPATCFVWCLSAVWMP